MSNNAVHSNELFDMLESLANEQHLIRIKTKGYSMSPTIAPGDIVIVAPAKIHDLKIGDIVVFRTQQSMIAHRLVAVNVVNGQNICVAKGDNNRHVDAAFSADAIVGKVIRLERNNKHIMLKNNWLKAFFMFRMPFLSYQFNRWPLSLKNLYAKIIHFQHDFFKNIQMASKGSMGLVFVNLFLAIMQAIMPFVLIYIFKFLIDGISNVQASDIQHSYLLFLLVLAAFTFFLNAILTDIRSYTSEKLAQSVNRYIYTLLHQQHAHLALSYYENHAEQDKIHRAVHEAGFRPLKIINETIQLTRSLIAAVVLFIVFISVQWYLVPLLFVAVLPSLIVRVIFAKKSYTLKKDLSSTERRMYYFNRVLTAFPFAKEMKLFGFASFFKNKFNVEQNKVFDANLKHKKAELKANVATQLFAVLLIFAALILVMQLFFDAKISLGTVVLFFFAFQRAYGVVSDLFSSLARLVSDQTFLKDFNWFMQIDTVTQKLNADTAKAFSLKKSIVCNGLTFKYETSKRNALNNVNFEIAAGSKVAFVGPNGSGKSTLVKMLCGFYTPNSGQILFDGKSIEAIGAEQLRANITAVFQDFALYYLSVSDNISLGDKSQAMDMTKVVAAAKAANVHDLIASLPSAYDSILGNQFENGEELSIGQWQKMAIARAFYRNTDLVIMDEPSSALDADAELQITETLKHLSHNKTAIVISHRLSTIRWVDKIFYFDNGCVIESGTHDELMTAKGAYYELWNKSVKISVKVNDAEK